MLPSNSNLNKENCSSTSSNCVVWQGPDIPAINLCNGDSVSEVIYKLGEEILILQENIGVSGVELDQLVKVCQLSPTPSKTLANILDLLIDKVICIDEAIKDLPPGGTPYVEPALNYPSCFSPLINDKLSDYAVQLANKICSVSSTVSTHTSQIAVLTDKVTTLEGLVPTPLPNLNSCLSGIIQPLNVVVQNLETQFCDIKEGLVGDLGDGGDLTGVLAYQCTGLNGQKSLVDSTKLMITKPGWVASPQTFAESMQNLWITVCDIRGAVRSILDNCCKAGCDDILIDAYIKWSTVDDGILLVNFLAKSRLPIGFYDCGETISSPGSGTNEFIFTDVDGLTAPEAILFRSIDPTSTLGVLNTNNPDLSYGWFEIDMNAMNLNLDGGPIQMTADLCFTDGTTQCIKCVSFTIPAKPADKCCEIKATGNVTIVYSTC